MANEDFKNLITGQQSAYRTLFTAADSAMDSAKIVTNQYNQESKDLTSKIKSETGSVKLRESYNVDTGSMEYVPEYEIILNPNKYKPQKPPEEILTIPSDVDELRADYGLHPKNFDDDAGNDVMGNWDTENNMLKYSPKKVEEFARFYQRVMEELSNIDTEDKKVAYLKSQKDNLEYFKKATPDYTTKGNRLLESHTQLYPELAPHVIKLMEEWNKKAISRNFLSLIMPSQGDAGRGDIGVNVAYSHNAEQYNTLEKNLQRFTDQLITKGKLPEQIFYEGQVKHQKVVETESGKQIAAHNYANAIIDYYERPSGDEDIYLRPEDYFRKRNAMVDSIEPTEAELPLLNLISDILGSYESNPGKYNNPAYADIKQELDNDIQTYHFMTTAAGGNKGINPGPGTIEAYYNRINNKWKMFDKDKDAIKKDIKANEEFFRVLDISQDIEWQKSLLDGQLTELVELSTPVIAAIEGNYNDLTTLPKAVKAGFVKSFEEVLAKTADDYEDLETYSVIWNPPGANAQSLPTSEVLGFDLKPGEQTQLNKEQYQILHNSWFKSGLNGSNISPYLKFVGKSGFDAEYQTQETKDARFTANNIDEFSRRLEGLELKHGANDPIMQLIRQQLDDDISLFQTGGGFLNKDTANAYEELFKLVGQGADSNTINDRIKENAKSSLAWQKNRLNDLYNKQESYLQTNRTGGFPQDGEIQRLNRAIIKNEYLSRNPQADVKVFSSVDDYIATNEDPQLVAMAKDYSSRGLPSLNIKKYSSLDVMVDKETGEEMSSINPEQMNLDQSLKYQPAWHFVLKKLLENMATDSKNMAEQGYARFIVDYPMRRNKNPMQNMIINMSPADLGTAAGSTGKISTYINDFLKDKGIID